MHLDVWQRQPFADGHHFDGGGQYEVLLAQAHYTVDQKATANAGITDLDAAETCDDGLVHFRGDVHILRPLDGGSGRLLFDWGNRGNKLALPHLCSAPATNDPTSLGDAGNGYLFRHGYTVVCGAWQGDLLAGQGRMLLHLPVAQRAGQPIRGLVHSEFVLPEQPIPTTTMPLSGRVTTRSHPAVYPDSRRANLVRRRNPGDEPEPISPSQWQFARLQGTGGPLGPDGEYGVVPCRDTLFLPSGFEPGWLYQLAYEGEAPLVLGLGHAAVRDLVAFLRYHPDSPVPDVQHAYGFGVSQTGRAARDFVYRGFNATADGRRVFDGLLVHVAGAGRLNLRRFANLTMPGGSQFEGATDPADEFPFAYAHTVDHLTGVTDAICKRPDTDPKILHTQTSTEYWQRRGSLVHTTTDGRDLGFPANVRGYLWASSQHGDAPPEVGLAAEPENVVDTSELFRPMLAALDGWVSRGEQPPASRVPTRADATLVPMTDWAGQFPPIPGVVRPTRPNELAAQPSAVTDQPTSSASPSQSGGGYAVLVPAVDADGNDVAGVRAPMVAAPLATYTGWAAYPDGCGGSVLRGLAGRTLPLPATTADAAAAGDPRVDVQSRYGDAAGYLAAVTAAAEDLVARRLLLAEDVERVRAAARQWSAPRHQVELD